MSKVITEKVHDTNCKFIISVADADNAVHINVRPHPDTLKLFNSFDDRQNILEWVATREAQRINPTAFKMYSQVNLPEEWQGQFDFQ